MKNVLLVILIIAFLPLNSFAWYATIVDTVENYWPNEQLKEKYILINWVGGDDIYKSGMYQSWHENGMVNEVGEYWQGQKVYSWIEWDSLGNKIKEISYVNGKKHGKEVEWHTNKTVKSVLNYRDDKLHGRSTWSFDVFEFSNPTDVINTDKFFLYGENIVTFKELHSIDNNTRCTLNKVSDFNSEMGLWSEWEYGCHCIYIGEKVDGLRHGKWVLWTENGDMKEVDFYDMGKKLEF